MLVDIWFCYSCHTHSQYGCRASSGLRSPVQQKIIVTELMTYVMDLTMLLRTIFHQTRTTQGKVPLSEALINRVLEGYINGPKKSIRTVINGYVDDLDDIWKFSSKDAAGEIRQLIDGNRFDFGVDVPTSLSQDNATDENRRILGSTSSAPARCV